MKHLKNKKHIYFIAIGGIGMSAVALVLLKRGYKVSGSDLKPNPLTAKLKSLGAAIYTGHNRANIEKDVDLVVHSSCIRPDNPEMLEAARRNIAAAPRGVILAELLKEKKGIAVCGCHGKTTTSAMIATVLTDAGLDPTALIGGEVNYLGSNARVGNGEYLVAEADESDGSFLKLNPLYSVVTNIDEDHMDYFKTKAGLVSRFREYVFNTKKGGCFIYSADDPILVGIKRQRRADSMGFGFKGTADIYAKNITLSNNQAVFDCFRGLNRLANFKICVPGIHNVSNALACICVALKLGLTTSQISSGLEKFTGTKRRFQIRGCFNGVTVVEDYAHHPAEIIATLKSAGGFKPGRIISIFQPHRFTRTLHLADRFGSCFHLSDHLVLTDIYSASENVIAGVTGKLLYDKVVKSGHKSVVYKGKPCIADYLCRIKKPGDMIVVLGAGDINSIADELVSRLKGKV